MKKIIISISFLFLALPIMANASTPSGLNPVGPTLNFSAPAAAASTQTTSSSGLSACQSLGTIANLSSCALGIINLIIPFILALTIVWVILSSFNLTRTEGEDRKKWGLAIFYGIVAIFIMVSVYGLVNILTGTFHFNSTQVSSPTINNIISQ